MCSHPDLKFHEYTSTWNHLNIFFIVVLLAHKSRHYSSNRVLYYCTLLLSLLPVFENGLYVRFTFPAVSFCRSCCLWVRLRTIRTGGGWRRSTTLCWQGETPPAAKHSFTTAPSWASGMRTAGTRHIRFACLHCLGPLRLQGRPQRVFKGVFQRFWVQN